MIKRAELTIIANTYSSDPLSVTLESLHTKTIKSDYTMSSPISEGSKGNEVASYNTYEDSQINNYLNILRFTLSTRKVCRQVTDK